MPRQKQSKPKALKQQREEVEQLIRDGETSDLKKQDADSSVESSKHSAVHSSTGKGKRRHRHKNAIKVEVGKKVHNKRITKALQAKDILVGNDADVKDSVSNLNPNNNEKPVIELKELDSPELVAEVGSDAVSDSFLSDADIVKDKYDMIKERSLQRATKVKQTLSEKDKVKDIEGSPKKGSDSPKKTPTSPLKEPGSHPQKSPTKAEAPAVQLSTKPRLSNSQRKSSEESGRHIAKGRQRCVSEGMLTSHDTLSKQHALEALLQITGVELHTMSKVPNSGQAVPCTMSTVTSSAPNAPHTSLTGLNKGNMVKISESDFGVVKYHLQSDSLEEQGLKLVYTAQAVGQTNQEQIKYSAYRPRKNSTRSNASDSADDPTAKDSQKCCKKPGRHVCQFCGRRCTKPSVLKKHIRSHTGERPYPCSPCGFSFKTKSNLYKHCKTHAHAIKAGLTPNSEELSKLALPDLDEDDSEETESEDEITTCDATTCQTELTEKMSHSDARMHVGSVPQSGMEPYSRTSQEDRSTKGTNIPMMQVHRSLAAVPTIPQRQADSQSNQETVSRHSSWVSTQTSVLPTSNIKMDMPLLSTLLPKESLKSSNITSFDRPSSAPSASVEFSKTSHSQQDRHHTPESRNDDEVVMSASGASSSQLLKSILPGELAGFRIDMETRRAIPVLNPQLGTPGSSPTCTTQSTDEASSNPSQLLIPLTGFNIVKSGGQYHVQIPVQGISEDSLTMSLDGETGSSVDDTSNSSSLTKGVSKESLQERIQLLISQNRAIVDNTVLESVKPRRTSASRRDSENNSPRMELTLEPPSEGKFQEGRVINPSGYQEYNAAVRHRRNSLSEAQYLPSVTQGPGAGYPLAGEGNLLERVLKSQQKTAKGPSAVEKILVPLRDFPANKFEASTHQTGNSGDNRNSIKDLLMQDRPRRLAQIAQHSPVQMSVDSPGGGGSPGIRFIPGSSWPFPQGGESAMNQLRGTLQQHRAATHAQSLMYPSLYTTEDVNVSQRISELRGTGKRRKYKSESDVFGDVMPSGPSSPKRRARKIKDMPSVVSPLASSSAQRPSSNMPSSQTLAEPQRSVDVKPASSHGSSTSYPGQLSSLPYPSPAAHIATYPTAVTSGKSGHSAPYTSHTAITTPGHVTQIKSHMPSMHSHMSQMQSHMTSMRSPSPSVSSHMISLGGVVPSVTTTQYQMPRYPSPMMSVPGLISHPGQPMSQVTFESTYSGQRAPVHLPLYTTVPQASVTSVYTQSQPVISEVSVIQHTRMQSKSEPSNKELKLEVSQAKDGSHASYPWHYRYPVPTRSPGAASPASQGLHLLAVASKSPDLSSNLLTASRKRSFSVSEGIQTVRKQQQQMKLPALNSPPEQMEKHRPNKESNNAAPIAMQLLAAVAHGSSYAPRLSPRVQDANKTTSESGVSFQSPSAQPSKRSPSTSLKGVQGTSVSSREQPSQPVMSIPQQRQVESPKRIKLEQNLASPKSPRCDARSPRSDASRQSPTTLPKVPASRRHLKLDLKSPLTSSRMKSPGAADSQKSLLQIDPKSLLTPEALSIAESVMKLASPMKANTPITPVESARELGRLMAHAFHNAGGKVESLITSTQGTMMIGPIATPTPGAGSGSAQYFIIPSPSSSQPPTGFPGPNTLFSPTVVSTPSLSLVSPLKSPLATPLVTSQPQGDEAVVCTVVSPHYKRVPPQKPDNHGPFEKQVFGQVKTNSALRQKARYSKLSRSTARNSKITRTTCCCDKRPQPMYVQQGSNRKISMYSNWRTGTNSPHPLGISWKAHLGLYDSSRNKKPRFYYVTTSISPPQGGILTDSAGWKPETAVKTSDAPLTNTSQQAVKTSTIKPSDAEYNEKSMLESDPLKSKEKKAKEASEHHEPSRVQIFSGGYKSNEDYVYVRGRGRGKYVCEECGIRCKKPSMLKKHIRTHTDMRPYQCQICNFAFKTKGNLTKHMKSKAHSKKCTKNGISATDDSCMEHQFSDADDEDTDSADGDTTDEEEDEDEDDDISETQSESAVPVSGIVPHRERYSSVPNIQDMPDSFDSQGRPLVWHQYHPGRSKKDQTESQERPRRDSTGSIPTSDSPKSGTASKDDEKQPVKLSRSEVVGKLSRHLTNRHQQSLEKAQKASVSAIGVPGEGKDQGNSEVFDISQLPPFTASAMLPQPTNHTNIIQPLGNKSDTKPPAPPVLDKYGHIVLTTSTSSTSQYRLSTTIQGSLSSRSKPVTNNGLTNNLTSPPPVLISSSSEKQKSNPSPRASQPNTESFPTGSPLLPSQVQSTVSTITPLLARHLKDQAPGFVRTPSCIPTASASQTNVSWAFTFPPHHEPQTATVPLGASNLVVGVNPMHAMSNREMHLFPHYVVASEAQPAAGSSPRAYPPNFGVFPHGPRIMSPPFLAGFQDPTRPVTSPGVNSSRPVLRSPTPPAKPKLSPRINPTSAGLYPTSNESTQSLPPPIFVEAISDDEDEHGLSKRQKGEMQHNKILVSGSIHPGDSVSSVPSWMYEPGSAIKQLLLARPSLIPPLQESAKFPFLSQFLPPSLASPKMTKSSPMVLPSSSLQPPLVSPMVPSKMMQLPPTILSQVRSPTVQSSSFPQREEHRDSPGPFVPPVARAKSQFQMAPPQSQMASDKSPNGDQIPVEVAEELVSSPTQSGNHKCSSCHKIFMKPSQLRIHMRIHLEENAFSCPECLLSFSTRILLAKHERSEEHLSKVDAVELPSASNESDPRPFKCKECQIAFRIPGHLAKHLRSRGHRMTLEREGKLPLPKDELLSPDAMSDVEQGDLIIDDSHHPSSPAGSSDKTDSASEAGDMEHMDTSLT